MQLIKRLRTTAHHWASTQISALESDIASRRHQIDECTKEMLMESATIAIMDDRQQVIQTNQCTIRRLRAKIRIYRWLAGL
jgi:hypothetical protein